MLNQVTQKQRDQASRCTNKKLKTIASSCSNVFQFGISKVASCFAGKNDSNIASIVVISSYNKPKILKFSHVTHELFPSESLKIGRSIVEILLEVLRAIKRKGYCKRFSKVGVELYQLRILPNDNTQILTAM